GIHSVGTCRAESCAAVSPGRSRYRSGVLPGCPQPGGSCCTRDHRLGQGQVMDERAAGAVVYLTGDLDRNTLEKSVRAGTLQRLRRGAYGPVVEGEVRSV